MFSTRFSDILQALESIDIEGYGHTRNYLRGNVTRISPYISRGVISTPEVLKYALRKNLPYAEVKPFLMELCWRDYWQEIWMHDENMLLQPDHDTPTRDGMPQAVVKADTGIEAINRAILELYETGYLHNHLRMYVAALVCNNAGCNWKTGARWMHYHLLDADPASNFLSWQWVAGLRNGKKYYANQENINKYADTHQTNTYLDIPYDAFSKMQVPEVLKETVTPSPITPLPVTKQPVFDHSRALAVYTPFHLDPRWLSTEPLNRVLLLPPSFFNKFPMAEKSLRFILDLAANIEGIQVFTGECQDLLRCYPGKTIYFREHPMLKDLRGEFIQRPSVFPIYGFFPSFFAYWKQCEKFMKRHPDFLPELKSA